METWARVPGEGSIPISANLPERGSSHDHPVFVGKRTPIGVQPLLVILGRELREKCGCSLAVAEGAKWEIEKVSGSWRTVRKFLMAIH